MANCIRCGRALPSFSWGNKGDLCADCRKGMLVDRNAPSTPVGADPWRNPPTPGEILPPQTSVPTRIAAARRTPVTMILVGANIAVFVLMALSGVSLSEPRLDQLIKWGADFGPLSLSTQPWRVLTSNYVHIGIVHIFFNMWCLWNLGALAERVFDPWTYLLVYTASGITGSLASLWWHPLVVGAGASGAIFGLAGALIAALYLGKLPIPKESVRGTMKSLLMFAAYNLFFGLAGGIDNAAHLGGLVGGFALGAAYAPHLMDAPDERRSWRNYLLIAVVVVVALAMHFLRAAHPVPAK
jgi:rhomboid protease GluP